MDLQGHLAQSVHCTADDTKSQREVKVLSSQVQGSNPLLPFEKFWSNFNFSFTWEKGSLLLVFQMFWKFE